MGDRYLDTKEPATIRIPTIAATFVSVCAVSAQGRSFTGPRASSAWHDLASIPLLPPQEHAAVAINSTAIAVLGGITGSSATGVWNNTDLVTLYDVPSDMWTPAAPLPVALNHPNAAVVDGKIYLLGGLAETLDQNGTWRAVPDCWVYDPARDRWEPVTRFPPGTERGSAAVGIFGTKIYLAGGLRSMETVPGGTIATVDDVSVYDTATDTWTPLGTHPLPQPRDHAGGAVVANVFYVIGGRHVAGGLLASDSVYVLGLAAPDRQGRARHGGVWRPDLHIRRGGKPSGGLGGVQRDRGVGPGDGIIIPGGGGLGV
ncbi:kelch domain-containing protein [Colletotrichum graminicola]|uniref:Kelch domain-containing protein n=1 Tax=Colletotrichum graminicola (strain M1.001 / M2 / FGSC 10212) TaxID=645133 RepID=E3QL58_COLGM|nr:kelch domain-containing protein [Colletotrichum graminicola M1.001]EFQ31596.1 kelch domain-containing protein [Colletotrichum graminicola M1.001]WDK10163.1 kelch domain-containing protein [Colletotrichum graminicola]